jgi:hypothetical protein
MKISIASRIGVIVLALGFTAGPASAAAIHGAIFTTDVAGSVNVNIYENKEDVYLNGGPKDAPCTAAALDDGVYVFQITNPSGSTLLSTADISLREFTVSGGVITATTGVSVAGDCGGIRVQMAPFDNTPNNGGEYKVWITRKADYLANGNTFKPGSIKTDNFKVKVTTAPETSGLLVYKFYDANGNGVWDGDNPLEIPLFGWSMNVTNGNGFDATGLTQSPDGLVTFSNLPVADNPYSVLEGTAGPRWVQSAAIVNGVSGSVQNPITGLNLVAGVVTQVDFGNYCTCIVRPYPVNFWLGTAGQNKLNDGATMNPEFTLLRNANLRNASGGHFNFNLLLPQADNYNTFSAWLMGAGSSSNVAYKLSVQLAVLKLNMEAGFVRGVYFDKDYGGTISELIADANSLLSNTTCGTTCNTTTATQLGTDQQALLDLIADVNDGTTLIMPKPCAYSFTLPTN